MARKKTLFSRFFGFMLAVVPFIFDTLFAIALFLGKSFVLVVSLFFKRTKTELGKKQAARKKPKGTARYVPFEILKTNEGNFGQFEIHLMDSKSSIGIILGARGSGKSALGMRLLENVTAKTGRLACAMGFSEENLPRWIRTVKDISDAPNGSFVLIDEGGILFSSRGSMSNPNKLLSAFLLVARHKDLSVLFISQNSANLEVNAIRQADYLLLRRSSLLQKDFERKKIKEVYADAEAGFSEFSSFGNRLTYVYSNEFRGYIINQLPSFWNDKTSKSFSNFRQV